MEHFNPFSLSGKKIIVTGASSGIGRQCAIDISKFGGNVILLGRDFDRLNETASNIETEYVVRQLDLSNLDLIPSTIQDILKESGRIDGFVHCAGIEKTLPLKLTTSAIFEDLYRTNLLSAVEIIKVITQKKNHNTGMRIVMISSITSLIARNGTAPYTASKGAMNALCREMAIELAKKKINVNCISPGTILTPLMQRIFDDMDIETREKRIGEFPLGLGVVEDISLGCVYLLGTGGRWITGQNIVIDGGRTLI